MKYIDCINDVMIASGYGQHPGRVYEIECNSYHLPQRLVRALQVRDMLRPAPEIDWGYDKAIDYVSAVSCNEYPVLINQEWLLIDGVRSAGCLELILQGYYPGGCRIRHDRRSWQRREQEEADIADYVFAQD